MNTMSFCERCNYWVCFDCTGSETLGRCNRHYIMLLQEERAAARALAGTPPPPPPSDPLPIPPPPPFPRLLSVPLVSSSFEPSVLFAMEERSRKRVRELEEVVVPGRKRVRTPSEKFLRTFEQ